MTVLVGVRCSDGVVIGADSLATSSMGPSPLVSLPSNSKIQIFNNNIIVACTGSVGLAQRLHFHVEEAIRNGVFKGLNIVECFGNLPKRLLGDMQNSGAPRHPHYGINFGALLAVTLKDEAYLVEYDTTNFQPEIKKDRLFFVAMGSGQQLAEPFLAFVSRVLWNSRVPTIEQAKFGIYWVLDHTIKLAPGGVGGAINLSTLQKKGGAWTAEMLQDTQEAAQYITELEAHIGGFARKTIEDAEVVPLPPPPPTARA